MPLVSEPAPHARSYTEEIVKHENSFKWLPAILEEFCTGCGRCVAACGPACLGAQHVLEMFRRTLPNGTSRRRLDRLSNRLTKILSEARKLPTP